MDIRGINIVIIVVIIACSVSFIREGTVTNVKYYMVYCSIGNIMAVSIRQLGGIYQFTLVTYTRELPK